MTNEVKAAAACTAKPPAPRRRLVFFLALSGLIAFAVVRSSFATRLDSFTFDEGYHVGAGAAYVKTGDFRLNPEHPPLTKLWAGAFVAGAYHLSPYRPFQDKNDERRFVEGDVYFNSDPEVVQKRARAGMFALNCVLLFLFALAARRVFGDRVALAATAFLAIDPTVAAHLPVVMTDLPVALLSATAVMLSVHAFRSWRAVDLILAALALGLALGAKHSAVITAVAVAAIGFVMAVFHARGASPLVRLRRLGAVAAVLTGAVVVLWGFYLFRFSESPSTPEEQFNRPLAEKISDVKSPLYRAGLNVMWRGQLLPRAYTWGLADTIRAGAEGRVASVLAFGNLYYSKAPFYYFPGVIAVKLPLGLLLLSAIGAGLLVARKIPEEYHAPAAGMAGFALLFLVVLARGASYGSIRHALPVVPLLAVLASFAVYRAVKSKSRLLRGSVVVAAVAALVSALPVTRPWEYYNETIGGAANGHRYFNDEGVDISQRTKEIADYYHRSLKPSGEVPYVMYPAPPAEARRRVVDWVGKDPERDRGKWDGETATGVFVIGANQFAPALWWDSSAFRQATPVARFGNLFVFRGTFRVDKMKATRLAFLATNKIYAEKPDIEGAVQMLSESLGIDPKAFFVAIELGNQYLKLGKREEALRAYRLAKEHVPPADETSEQLARQIRRVEAEPLEQIQPLRNPGIE